MLREGDHSAVHRELRRLHIRLFTGIAHRHRPILQPDHTGRQDIRTAGAPEALSLEPGKFPGVGPILAAGGEEYNAGPLFQPASRPVLKLFDARFALPDQIQGMPERFDLLLQLDFFGPMA